MNIEKHLQRWTKAELISREQSDKIVAFEAQQPSTGWVLFGLSGLGIFVILTGIVSLVAANWEQLSATTKLSAYFIVFTLLAVATFKRARIAGVVRESLFSAFGLYALAGVGLIGQIYHLRSDGYQGLFFWIAIILPITLATRSRLLNNIWFIGLISACTIWVSSENSRLAEESGIFSRYHIGMSLPFIFLAIGYRLQSILSEFFCTASRFWSYVIILVPFAVIGNILWASGGRGFHLGDNGITPVIPLLAVAISLFCIVTRKIFVGSLLTYAICTTLVTSVFLFIIPSSMAVGKHEIVGCVLFILLWSCGATIAAAMQRKRLFDLAASIIGIRFIIVYFEVFGSLAATGLGLILSGIVILGTAYAWHRYRGRVVSVIQEAL